MNFLFININYHGEPGSADTVPISPGYVLAYLKSQGHGGVILGDVTETPLSLHVLETRISELEPAVIGFSAYQCNMERIRFFSHYIKSHHKDIAVVLGGPQALFVPSAALRELEDIDMFCRGDGEIISAGIAQCLENNKPLSSARGLTVREDGQIIDTEPELDIPVDLDRYPSPYLADTINLEGKDEVIMLASRGCEDRCLFCITPSASHGEIRHHSAKRVLDEMEYLTEKGVGRFWFADPNFTASYEKTMEILRGKIDRGIKTSFWCQTRTDMVDEQMLKTLREAGADTIAFGLESSDPGVLKGTAKGIAIEHLRRMIKVAKSIGMDVELFSAYGLPGETFEQARQTLDFVRACKVPVQLNSHAQQIQLYFGSAYEKTPARFGFKEISGYRPAYLSIGDQYETENLERDDIRKIKNIWALADEQVSRNVQYIDKPFDVLDFLLGIEEDLSDEELFYEHALRIICVLEEPELLWKLVNGYVNRLNPGKSRLNKLISKLNIFKETKRCASAKSRVIFDCRSEMGGVLFPGMKNGYWDIMLGQNHFLPAFEKGFIGVKGGEETTFEFSFPEDYIQPELRGENVKVWAEVYKVMDRVTLMSLKKLESLNIRNHYTFNDIERLRQENDVLYYLVLKDIPEHELVEMPVHFLRLIYYYAKLRRFADIKRMAGLLANEKNALDAIGDTLYSAGSYNEAADCFGEAFSGKSGTLIKKARSLYLAGEAQKALDILNSMPESSAGLSFQELLLGCLKEVQPDSKRIPLLDRHVLDLTVKAVFEKETRERSRQ